MIWLFLITAWFLQLHFIESAAWFGVAWPLFAAIILLNSHKLDKYKLSWLLLFLGVLADLSSHLLPTTVLRGYIFLIAAIWLLTWLNKHLNNIRFSYFFKFLLLILLINIFFFIQTTSWSSLFLSLQFELIIISVMAFIIFGWAVLFKNITRGKYDKA